MSDHAEGVFIRCWNSAADQSQRRQDLILAILAVLTTTEPIS